MVKPKSEILLKNIEEFIELLDLAKFHARELEKTIEKINEFEMKAEAKER